jgi:hypothetical protein
MSMKDLHSKIKVSPAIAPAAIRTGNATTTSNTIDTDGFAALEFLLQAGAITDGTWTVSVFHGDAANMSDEAQCAAADLIGTAQPTLASGDSNTCKRVGYKGGKRYVRVKAVQAGATTGGFISAVAVQGEPVYAPVP